MKEKDSDLKDRSRWSTTLSTDLYLALSQLHEETEIPKSKLADKAIRLLLKEYGKL